MRLLRGLYPECNNIVVERMPGGGFNRIVGATLLWDHIDHRETCVTLAIPTHSGYQVPALSGAFHHEICCQHIASPRMCAAHRLGQRLAILGMSLYRCHR
jgi:hypothetical protein